MSDARDPDAVALRRELVDRLAIAPVAFSPDGLDVAFAGPLSLGLAAGDVAVVDTPAGRLLVQVHEVEVVEIEGAELQMELAGLGASVKSVSARVRVRAVHGRAVALGRWHGGEFVATAAGVDAFGEAALRAPTAAELGAVAASLHGDAETMEIGTWRQAPGQPACIRSKGFARHTFMCGQSGSGKTYTTGVLFEHLLADTSLPVVVLDPNSDHVHLGSSRDPDAEGPAAERFRRAAASVRVARSRGHDASHTLCADFSDLPLEFQALVLRLHPLTDLDTYAALRAVTAALRPPYSAGDVASAAAQRRESADLATRVANLGIDRWGLWRRPGESSIVGLDLRRERFMVLDLGSLAEPAERTAVAYSLLANRWARRAERQPVLIAVDEAHNVLPAATADPLEAATADLGVLIAGEGRKFGLHLFVATQRPAKVHPNVVSQCDNLVLMRMNGQADVDDLVGAFSHVPAGLLRQATRFGLGQALFGGPISPVPQLVQVAARRSPEGGGDVPTTWVRPADPAGGPIPGLT